jgi:soluble lytic murein transglycosylase-like protein
MRNPTLMKPKRAYRSSPALATLLFLALAVRSTRSDPAIPARSTPPPRPPVSPPAAFDRGTWWAGGPPLLSAAVVSHADLAAALEQRSQRFALFRPDSGVDARRELLGSLPYGAILADAGRRHHVDALLLAAVVEAESQFAPHVVSHCGAVGLMQLLPSTGQQFGIADLLDPAANVEAGSRYLRALLNRFQGRSDLALAAYNTGPEVVARYGCVPPFRETQGFVKRVLDTYAQHQRDLEQPPSGRLHSRMARNPHRTVTASRPSATTPPQPVVVTAR